MKKIIILLPLFLFCQLYSQDLLVREKGDSLEVRITSQDSTRYYFVTKVNGKLLQTSIDKSKVKQLVIDYYSELIVYKHEAKNKKGYYQNDTLLRKIQLVNLLYTNPSSVPYYRASKIEKYFGIFTTIGGLILVINSTDINGIIVGGAATFVAGIPLLAMSKAHLKKAVKIYNSGTKTSSIGTVELNLCASSDGIGLQIRF